MNLASLADWPTFGSNTTGAVRGAALAASVGATAACFDGVGPGAMADSATPNPSNAASVANHVPARWPFDFVTSISLMAAHLPCR